MSNKKEEKSDPRQLFVGQIPLDTTDEELKEVFKKYGEVETVIILKEPGGFSRGCGFVHFKEASSAKDAIEALHRKVSMQPSGEKLVVRPAGPDKNAQGFKVFVGALDRSSEEEQVRTLFAPFGELTSIFVLKSHANPNKRSAIVVFKNKADAKKAIRALNGKARDGNNPRTLVVKPAENEHEKELRKSKGKRMEPPPYGYPPPRMPPPYPSAHYPEYDAPRRDYPHYPPPPAFSSRERSRRERSPPSLSPPPRSSRRSPSPHRYEKSRYEPARYEYSSARQEPPRHEIRHEIRHDPRHEPSRYDYSKYDTQKYDAYYRSGSPRHEHYPRRRSLSPPRYRY